MVRRKIQPLSPSDVASLLLSNKKSVQDLTGSSFPTDEASQGLTSSSQTSLDCSHITLGVGPASSSSHDSELISVPKNIPSSKNLSLGFRAAESLSTCDQCPPVAAQDENETRFGEHKPDSSQVSNVGTIKDFTIHPVSLKAKTGYLAKRRSMPFVVHSEGQGDHSSSNPVAAHYISSPTQTPSFLLKHTPSVRLSLSLDGKAHVTTGSEDLPSPPRAQALPMTCSQSRPIGSLQRSYSANETLSSTSMVSRNSISGRSKDNRTWEFYCDSEAGNVLTEQAEREQSGSAVGPIGLIRSQSNKIKLPSFNKRNARMQKDEPAKKQKPGDHFSEKPKSHRAATSIVKLQHVTGNVQKKVAKVLIDEDEKTRKFAPKLRRCPSPSGDSDKENWEPGTQSRAVRGRRGGRSHGVPRGHHGLLLDSPQIPSHSSSLDILMNGEGFPSRRQRLNGKGSSGQQNINSTVNDEAANFMIGSSDSREVEDLEGVQNLLSLSQAAWQ